MIKKNEVGLWEVFSGNEMIARVSSQQEAELIDHQEMNKALAQVAELRAQMEAERP